MNSSPFYLGGLRSMARTGTGGWSIGYYSAVGGKVYRTGIEPGQVNRTGRPIMTHPRFSIVTYMAAVLVIAVNLAAGDFYYGSPGMEWSTLINFGARPMASILAIGLVPLANIGSGRDDDRPREEGRRKQRRRQLSSEPNLRRGNSNRRNSRDHEIG
jgi:hypothetical protein